MQQVVTKFQCHGNNPATKSHESQPDRQSILMGAVWEGSVEGQAKSENAIFGEATPCGTINMIIQNLTAADFFKPGKKYYVTFTEAD